MSPPQVGHGFARPEGGRRRPSKWCVKSAVSRFIMLCEKESTMRTVLRSSHWRTRVTFGLALTALLSALLGTGTQVAAAAPPNILFIVMDDVGIDQMRIFGYSEDNQPRTPNIDAIARWRALPQCLGHARMLA